VNDCAPQFRDSEIQLAIIEAAQVGSAYILPTASDDDSPDNGQSNNLYYTCTAAKRLYKLLS